MKAYRLVSLLAVGFLLASCNLVQPKAGLELVATVGTEPDVCASTTELDFEGVGPHTVYYCYTVTNTGGLTIHLHDLSDEVNGVVLDGFELALAPGESVNTVAAGIELKAELSDTTTNTATWDGFVAQTRVATAEASTTVNVTGPSVSLEATVGTEPGVCAIDEDISLAAAFEHTVYYCYTITNDGNLTIEVHDLADDLFGVILDGFELELAPGESVDTVTAGITLSRVIEAEDTTTITTNDATLDVYIGGERVAGDTATTTVTVVPPIVSASLTATVGTDPATCGDQRALAFDSGPQTVYYCYTITNTGEFTIPVHDLSDDLFGPILTGFEFDLGPGESVNTVAAGEVLARELAASTANVATWSGFLSTTAEEAATDSSTARVYIDDVPRYGAAAGVFTGASNLSTVPSVAQNIVFLGALGAAGAPVEAPFDVDITVPGYVPFTYTFDPARASRGVIALIIADFEATLDPAADVDIAFEYVRAQRRSGLTALGTIGGEYVIEFPDVGFSITVDTAAAVLMPVVQDTALNAERDALTVEFDANDARYELSAYGRGFVAATGTAVTTASPVVIALNGALADGEGFGVFIRGYGGDPFGIFDFPSQIDVAEYLYVVD